MRMWNVAPRLMCDQHLLGEHVEMHMFVGAMRKGVSMQGYIDGGLLEPAKLNSRHDELVQEMERRGMKHKSPLPEHPPLFEKGLVDSAGNLVELAKRCPACRALQGE